MFDYLKYRLELSRLKRHARAASKDYAEKSKRQVKDQDEFMELGYLLEQSDKWQNWIELFQTQYYQNVCNKLLIPMPDKNEDNYYKYDFDNEQGDMYILKTKGFYEARNLIRKEKEYKRNVFALYFGILMTIIGITLTILSQVKK